MRDSCLGGGTRVPNRISSSGGDGPDWFKLDQLRLPVVSGRRRTVMNCNPNCNRGLGSLTVEAAGRLRPCTNGYWPVPAPSAARRLALSGRAVVVVRRPFPHRTDCGRPIRWREGVKGGFACTLTGHFPLCSLPCGHSHA